jgi:hypothetical protein
MSAEKKVKKLGLLIMLKVFLAISIFLAFLTYQKNIFLLFSVAVSSMNFPFSALVRHHSG